MTDDHRLIMARALDPKAFEGESGYYRLRRERAFEEVDAQLAALAAVGKVIEDDWRDIEGAPKSRSEPIWVGNEMCMRVATWEGYWKDFCKGYDLERHMKLTSFRRIPTPPGRAGE